MRGGFFDLYDMSPGGGVYPTFTFGNYTFPNVTIYRHLCKGINVYRRPNVYVCNQAEMEAPYRDPVGDLAVTAFPFTVQNPEPCSDQFAQRNVTGMNSCFPSTYSCSNLGGEVKLGRYRA